MTAQGQPYDVHAKLEDPAGVLSIALAQWETRDDSIPQAGVRRAANKAMDAIDGMLSDLYVMRSRLIDEIHRSDDETGRRTEELLARCRAARGAGVPGRHLEHLGGTS